MMVDKKDTPDNVILFPKIPRKRPNQKAAELDAKRQEMMRLQHNKVYVQAISEQLTETMLLTLRDENIDITNKRKEGMTERQKTNERMRE